MARGPSAPWLVTTFERDLAARDPQVAAALEALVKKTFTGFGPQPALDRETEERLRTLGYVN